MLNQILNLLFALNESRFLLLVGAAIVLTAAVRSRLRKGSVEQLKATAFSGAGLAVLGIVAEPNLGSWRALGMLLFAVLMLFAIAAARAEPETPTQI